MRLLRSISSGSLRPSIRASISPFPLFQEADVPVNVTVRHGAARAVGVTTAANIAKASAAIASSVLVMDASRNCHFSKLRTAMLPASVRIMWPILPS